MNESNPADGRRVIGYIPITRILVIILALLVLALSSVHGDHVIEMTNRLTFIPDTLHVSVGDRVTWKNTSMLVHTVTADSAQSTVEGSVRLPEGAESFDSGSIDPGDEFSRKLHVPGIYTYFCIPHEGAGMWGTIIVEGD